jgi:hypothetical protein
MIPANGLHTRTESDLMIRLPVQRGAPVAERDRLQPGELVAAAGAAQEDRWLVIDQLAAAAGEDRRATGETCPLLLVALGGGSSDETVVCQHVGADSGAACPDRVARVGAVGNSIPRPPGPGGV